jgi:hypothetical protein
MHGLPLTFTKKHSAIKYSGDKDKKYERKFNEV